MKYYVSFFFLLLAMHTFGQASFPKGFTLIAGDHPLGEDDRYSNGKDVFQTHLFFRSYDDYTWNDDKVKKRISEGYGFPVYRTADSLLWGTGKKGELYTYIVVDWGGEIFELFSRVNDADFSTYSKWLLTSIREYRKQGKWFVFPRRFSKG
jgi:hypothetical protein